MALPHPPPPPTPAWVVRSARRNDLVKAILPNLAGLVSAKALSANEAADVAADMADAAMDLLTEREGRERDIYQRQLAARRDV